MASERAHSLIEQVLQAVTPSAEEPDPVTDTVAPEAAAETGGRSWGARLRRLLLVGALVAVGAGVARWLKGSSGDNWQSSYVPAAPPGQPESAAADAVPEAADEGGAEPGEAVADAASEPHAVTTPDDPAEVIEVSEEK